MPADHPRRLMDVSATGERYMAEVILAIQVEGHHHPAPAKVEGDHPI